MILLCKVKMPDQVQYHWHGRYDWEKCVNVALDAGLMGQHVLLPLMEGCVQYKELNAMGYIVEEERLTMAEYVDYQDKMRMMADALTQEPS